MDRLPILKQQEIGVVKASSTLAARSGPVCKREISNISENER